MSVPTLICYQGSLFDNEWTSSNLWVQQSCCDFYYLFPSSCSSFSMRSKASHQFQIFLLFFKVVFATVNLPFKIAFAAFQNSPKSSYQKWCHCESINNGISFLFRHFSCITSSFGVYDTIFFRIFWIDSLGSYSTWISLAPFSSLIISPWVMSPCHKFDISTKDESPMCF